MQSTDPILVPPRLMTQKATHLDDVGDDISAGEAVRAVGQAVHTSSQGSQPRVRPRPADHGDPVARMAPVSREMT
ncbi:hypothetical protein GCM10010381_66750 [Streptomyces xantholiticus]|nr:hypothetical protein GCM10010381_66750 [Streptomyces xantholiticus]